MAQKREIEQIYYTYADMVYRIGMMMLKNTAEAEDALQNVFVRLIRSDQAFRDSEHLKAWLIVTTKNICRDTLKSWWRQKRVDSESMPEIAGNMDEMETDAWLLLTSLPEKLRLPVYLYYYEGYKTKEIAQLLDVNHATVRTRLQTAKKRLRVEEGLCHESTGSKEHV